MSNAQPQGVNAYQQTTSAAKTPRELEREVIARVTHQLNSPRKNARIRSWSHGRSAIICRFGM